MSASKEDITNKDRNREDKNKRGRNKKSINKENRNVKGQNRGNRKKERQLAKALHLYKRALKLMCRESGAYTAILFINWILDFCMPYWGIWFSARLLDEVMGGRMPERLAAYVALLLSGNLLLNLLRRVLSSLEEVKRYEFMQKEKMLFAEKMADMDYEQLEDEKVHALYNRVDRETFCEWRNLETLRQHLPVFLGCLAGMALSVAMVWELLVKMSEYGLLLLLFVLFAAGSIWVNTKCSAFVSKITSQCNTLISESCTQRDGYMYYFSQYEKGKEIRIYQLGKLMLGRLAKACAFNEKALAKRNQKSIFSSAISNFAGRMLEILTYCLTGFAALMGKITLGSMLQYTQSISCLFRYIGYAGASTVTLWYNSEYLERYFEFLDMPSRMRKGCLPVEKRADREYSIVFDHVSFRYPGSDKYALKDVNLEFKIGEKLAVVGMNGSGKSTFIKLLCRLYDPTEGTIYMNGIDIRRYDYREYRNLFSVVFQDFKLFSFALGENVAVSEEFSEVPVRDALVKAGLEDFLKEHEDNLSLTLYRDFDKSGIEVSGGEAQKIALARAVCKGAPFVLLDEPTAAMDPLAEYEIYKRFNDLVADRTTVYISHRMSSCRFCGDIAVFHEGHVVQRGSHETLMEETDGKYYELWTAQAQYYTEAPG